MPYPFFIFGAVFLVDSALCLADADKTCLNNKAQHGGDDTTLMQKTASVQVKVAASSSVASQPSIIWEQSLHVSKNNEALETQRVALQQAVDEHKAEASKMAEAQTQAFETHKAEAQQALAEHKAEANATAVASQQALETQKSEAQQALVEHKVEVSKTAETQALALKTHKAEAQQALDEHKAEANATAAVLQQTEQLGTAGLRMPHVVVPEVSNKLSYLGLAAMQHLDPFHKDRTPLKNQNIWNKSHSWVNFTFWHPAGVISNVYRGKAVWANVSFLSLSQLGLLSFVAYPAIPVLIVLIWGIGVSLCIQSASQDEQTDDASDSVPYISPSKLTKTSQAIYSSWKLICCCLPALLVFGAPMGLVALSYPYPQEVFVLTLVISSAFAFSHGMYMVVFVPFVLARFEADKELTANDVFQQHASINDVVSTVRHWVFFPNYKEDLEVLQMAVGSVAESTLARKQIGIVLAMEEREEAAADKANRLRAMFKDRFCDIQICHHPKDLPNDPPGKASNMAYAFKELVRYLESTGQDASKVMLTVADADSEFHTCYFEELTCKFLETDDPDTTVWQSPVYHFKNYHRQPGAIVVGSLVTAMVEVAYLVDPNAIRFPYSTYSIPLQLADKVGGWDPEWIAEDWHMGIKCFLLTLGRSQVKSILLPTLNYSPEEATWSGTIQARWGQARRHALGFSDLSYFFMMLPLIFVQITSKSKSPGLDLRGFWKLIFVGFAHIVRLINTHVIIGVLTLYGILDMGLRKVMMLTLGEIRGISELFDRTFFAATMFAVATTMTTLIVIANFQVLYKALVRRFEAPPNSWAWMYNSRIFHGLFNAICFVMWGTFYFCAMAAAVWMAAIKCICFWRTGGFEYEVASKPTKRNHL